MDASDGGGGTDGGDGGGGSDADATPNTTKITGQAFSRAFDLPLSGARVVVSGLDSTTTTANDGTFSFTTTTPYTMSILQEEPSAGSEYDVFEGLTTATPILESGRYDGSKPFSAKISGKVSGITSPVPPQTVVYVFARSTGNSVANAWIDEGAETVFTIAPNWKGGTSKDIMVRAFAYTSVGGYPTSFLGYAEANVTVNANDTISELELPLKKMATRKIEGSFTGPTYAAWLYPELYFFPRTKDGASIGWEAPAETPFGLEVPDIPGATLRLEYGGDQGGETVTVKGSSPIVLSPTGAATPIAPAPGASFTPGMTFSWKPPADTRGTYRFRLESGATDPALQIWTKASSVTVPGTFAPTSGKTYTWSLAYFASLATVDEAVVGGAPGDYFAPKGQKLVIP